MYFGPKPTGNFEDIILAIFYRKYNDATGLCTL